MTDLDLLAGQVGVSARTLRRAVNEGTLRGERSSPRRLRLAASEKEYILSRWHLLGRLRAVLRTESNVRFALLFGSTARGDDTETSGIDLLVEMREPSLVRLVDLELKLEAPLGRSVDLLSLADVESNPLLFAKALREGRVIVDRENRWAELHSQTAQAERRADDQSRRRGRLAVAGIKGLLTN